MKITTFEPIKIGDTLRIESAGKVRFETVTGSTADGYPAELDKTRNRKERRAAWAKQRKGRTE